MYTRPTGKVRWTEISEIYPEDAEWFKQHNVTVGMESLDDDNIVFYGETTLTDDDDEPIESIHICNMSTQKCKDALRQLRLDMQKLVVQRHNKAELTSNDAKTADAIANVSDG